MSYRSIKQVLGESSLERKLRILFAISSLLLIGGAFLYVLRITENLVRSNSQVKAQQMVLVQLLQRHLQNNLDFLVDPEGFKAMYQTLSSQIQTDQVTLVTKVLNQTAAIEGLKAEVASDPRERSLLQSLQEEFLAAHFVDPPPETTAESPPPDSAQPPAAEDPPHLFRDRISDDEYFYYQPLLFRSGCIVCHEDLQDPVPIPDPPLDLRAQSRLREIAWQQGKPVYFALVKLPYGEFKSALNRSRAVLLAVAIATVSLSTLFLYLIIRYVIVKPLRHLQDVSDRISHGQLDLRSDLNTGDEFEALSKSFNRMVRHLIDTQNALLAANRDLDGKIDEQARLAMHLFELNQIKSEFLTNMSHELRTPLNSIIGFSEVLEAAETLNERQRRYAGNIKRSGRLLLELINDILNMAKLEAGQVDARPTEFALAGLLAELADMSRPLAAEKRIELLLKIEDNLPPLLQDQIKVRQILTNLIANAIKFTPEGGRITLCAARSPSGDLQLQVQDTGVGIPADERDLIFEKFRQGSAALGENPLTREHSGTGLGLSIVRELCILLGGQIALESEIGMGSTFTVTLPWTLPELPRRNVDLLQRIDDLAKSQRFDFGRLSLPHSHPAN